MQSAALAHRLATRGTEYLLLVLTTKFRSTNLQIGGTNWARAARLFRWAQLPIAQIMPTVGSGPPVAASASRDVPM